MTRISVFICIVGVLSACYGQEPNQLGGNLEIYYGGQGIRRLDTALQQTIPVYQNNSISVTHVDNYSAELKLVSYFVLPPTDSRYRIAFYSHDDEIIDIARGFAARSFGEDIIFINQFGQLSKIELDENLTPRIELLDESRTSYAVAVVPLADNSFLFGKGNGSDYQVWKYDLENNSLDHQPSYDNCSLESAHWINARSALLCRVKGPNKRWMRYHYVTPEGKEPAFNFDDEIFSVVAYSASKNSLILHRRRRGLVLSGGEFDVVLFSLDSGKMLLAGDGVTLSDGVAISEKSYIESPRK